MAQVRVRIKTETPDEKNAFEKGLEKELLSYSQEIAQVINKGIKFTDNFDSQIKTISDSGLADSENTIAHTLKRVPTGYLILKINNAGIVYDSGTAWTDTNIYLKCSSANAAITILIF
jgi:hypothetical protein